jgi:hypothetical protein
MYKDNSDRPFYQLFSQLDATEKKFFRRYLEHLPGDQQKKYQLPLKVKSEIPRNAERYLFDHLLRFLRSFRAVSPRVEIMHHVTNAENLFLHQFPHLALQEIYKAEGICKQYEFLEEEFVVLSWKQKLRANLLLFEDAETTAHDLLENIKKRLTISGGGAIIDQQQLKKKKSCDESESSNSEDYDDTIGHIDFIYDESFSNRC